MDYLCKKSQKVVPIKDLDKQKKRRRKGKKRKEKWDGIFIKTTIACRCSRPISPIAIPNHPSAQPYAADLRRRPLSPTSDSPPATISNTWYFVFFISKVCKSKHQRLFAKSSDFLPQLALAYMVDMFVEDSIGVAICPLWLMI